MSASRLDALKKFLEQEPDDSFTKYALALEYASARDFKQAIASLKELIEKDPAYIPAYHQLGVIYAQLEGENDAIQTFEAGISVAMKAGDHHAAKEMQEAIDELEEGDN